MKSFRQYLEEKLLANLAAATAIATGAMAAPPKEEAVNQMVQYMKQKEGFRPVAEPDKDAKGNPIVVGYGTTHNYPDTGKQIKVGDKITPEKAEEHIRTYFKNMTPHLEKIPDWDKMDAGKQAALLSFGYNFGAGFYRPDAKSHEQFYSISQDLKNKNWENVPKSLSLYNKSGGKVLGGLVTRRKMEGQMWSQGLNNQQNPQPKPSQESSKDSSVEQASQASHTVVRGDNLTRIANKYGTTVEEIMKKNPQIKNPDRINPGQKINY